MEELVYTEEFTDDYKAKVLELIEASLEGKAANFTNAEFIILMHWKKHENDPAYSFVPEEYRGYR